MFASVADAMTSGAIAIAVPFLTPGCQHFVP